MTAALAGALGGWLLALALAVRLVVLHRRLELVADAEHELRGPVAAIDLAAHALGRTPATRARAAALAGQLDRLRAALADLEAARRGRRGIVHPEPLALDAVAASSAAGWEPAARLAGGALQVEHSGRPGWIRADRGRISQALGNLIANAVEHGGGRVAVRTGVAGDGRVRVEIADQGAPAGRRPLATRRGRGLAIAERAVTAAGGRLTATRLPGGGTAVTIDLPEAAPPFAPPGPASLPGPSPLHPDRSSPPAPLPLPPAA